MYSLGITKSSSLGGPASWSCVCGAAESIWGSGGAVVRSVCVAVSGALGGGCCLRGEGQHTWQRRGFCVPQTGTGSRLCAGSAELGTAVGSVALCCEVSVVPSDGWCLGTALRWPCHLLPTGCGTNRLIHTSCSSVPQESPWAGTLHYPVNRSRL